MNTTQLDAAASTTQSPPASSASGSPAASPAKVRYGYIPGKPSLTGRAVRAPVEYFTPEPAHAADLARVCFKAFSKLHDLHQVARDFPTLAVAEKVIGMLLSHPGFFRAAARTEGKPIGSNFLSELDEVGGVGPITVNPSIQGRSVGRGLMERVLDRADQRGVTQIRLVQETLNTASLALYTSQGFEVREPLGCMTLTPVMKPNPSVRPATPDDLPALDQLCRQFYKVSRKGELAAWMSQGFPVLLHERQGKPVAYYMPGKLGHGVAENAEDLVTLLGEAGRRALPETTTALCPLRHSDFYRAALQAGHRVAKVLTYMTIGPYEAPEGVWTPSYLY